MNEGDTVKVFLDVNGNPRKEKYHDRKGEITDIDFVKPHRSEDVRRGFRYTLKFEDGEKPDVKFRRGELLSMDEFEQKRVPTLDEEYQPQGVQESEILDILGEKKMAPPQVSAAYKEKNRNVGLASIRDKMRDMAKSGKLEKEPMNDVKDSMYAVKTT